MSEVTRILSAIDQGDPHAAEQLLPIVYGELRKLAAQKLAHEAPGQTLQSTAVVHDAYLRLVYVDKAQHWNSRGHFFAAQAEINQLDIDTRSDISSLGVLLYELLAGSPPFSRKELEKAGMLDMLRVIREQEPSKPSTKLSTEESMPTLAANRGTEPAKLTKLVRGELDWIAMKALEKDRNRRYETANGFAADVQRYLDDVPVQACPPSALYRFRKFTRRNKVALTTAAM